MTTKAENLLGLLKPNEQFAARIVLPASLSSSEVKKLMKEIDNRLDPRKVKSTTRGFEIRDDAFSIELDNKNKLIHIDGDISVKNDVLKILDDEIGVEGAR